MVGAKAAWKVAMERIGTIEFVCCARAASGHAAAALPSRVMNSRRFTAKYLRASERKDSTPRYGQETAALRDFDPAYDRCGSKRALWRGEPSPGRDQRDPATVVHYHDRKHPDVVYVLDPSHGQ